MIALADLDAAADALGYFGRGWRLICRDLRNNPRTVKDAQRELAEFIATAEERAPLVSRTCGAAATDAALAGIRGHKVLAARVKWSGEVPYLCPSTASAWRFAELHALRLQRAGVIE